ncbi:MAG: OmpA family protein [Bacteroidota bacterium]|nr:OmpA family protein [Candidatus Kapabacteria bacterium]MCX7937032.1 OmpA family protein [Chlorobiota bacterium]MDW8075503.1 OmpA family protein [Bacteroidota bacterium]MDW8272360.1 OmpA family protein [Bacteroidota bacterium]
MHEHDDSNRYLVSYADMVTLLVGVFAVLLTTFRADAERYRTLAQLAAQVFGSAHTADSLRDDRNLRATLAKLSPADVEHDSTTYRCIIADEVLFESGSSRLSSRAVQVLAELAAVLQVGSSTITIDGHTDSHPPRDGRTNVELSIERAAAVARALIDSGVPESRIVIRGFGASKPRMAEPASPKNRRVEILIALHH